MSVGRPKVPPPFPTPSEVLQRRADVTSPAVADLTARVQDALQESPDSQGRYLVHLQCQDVLEVVNAIKHALEQQGWEVQRMAGINDIDPILVIRPRQ